jgi:uncharacterized protein
LRTNVIHDYPSEYKEFLIHFHGTRDYFECHEILEEYWLEQNREIQWLALIQLAVAVYHERQENYAGSVKLYRRVLGHLQSEKTRFERLSIDVPRLNDQIEERLFLIKNRMPYYPMNLPVTDEKLLDECRETAENRRIVWNTDDRRAGKELVYRHRLRDRTEVIQARKTSLLEKQTKRQY